jgi:hypothetical protein
VLVNLISWDWSQLLQRQYVNQQPPSHGGHESTYPMLSPFVSAEADLEGEYSRLDGLTTAIMVISCTFLGLSLIAISLRTYVRLSRSLFRLDDGFMIAGVVSYFLHRRWDRSISLASICSFQVPGILHCSYLFDNKSPPRGYWKTRQAPRCVALKRGDKVLHHLDPHVCDRARDSQVLDLHDDFLRHRDTAQAAHRHICATSYDMGVLLYNLRRRPAILSSSQCDMDSTRRMRTDIYLCHSRPCCYCFDNRNGFWACGCASHHPVGYAYEKETEVAGSRIAIVCLRVSQSI